MSKNNNAWYERVNSSEYNQTENHEWYTPPEVFESLNTKFDIDVATIRNGLYWVPAKYHFHKDLDGFTKKSK